MEKAKVNQASISQQNKFRQAAREAETDDSEEAFDATLKHIARPPQKPKPQKSS